MRIVEDTPAQLRLRDRTAWVSIVLFLAAGACAIRFATAADDPVALVPTVLFVLFGLGFLRTSDVTFDKAARTCRIVRRDVFKVTRREVPFDEIANVRVDTSFADNAGSRSRRLVLVTTAGEAPLTAVFEPGQDRYEAMREAVAAAVFGLAPRPAASDSVQAMIKAGRLIDAITTVRDRDGLDLTEAKARVEAMKAAMRSA